MPASNTAATAPESSFSGIACTVARSNFSGESCTIAECSAPLCTAMFTIEASPMAASARSPKTSLGLKVVPFTR